VFAHWSLVAAAFALPALAYAVPIRAYPRFQFALVVGLTYVCLTVVHELAHAVVARCSGLKVYSLTISAFTGACLHEAPRTYRTAFAVTSAGLVVQFLLLAASQAYLSLVGMPESGLVYLVLLAFVYLNGLVILINLAPWKRRSESSGTDGYLLWKLAVRRLKGLPFGLPDTSATFAPETRLVRVRGFQPEGFTSGIEILNDNTTPMEFVVTTLSRNLEMSQEEAIKLMLEIHAKGGALVPLSPSRAETVAAAIAGEAKAAGHPLVCRVAVATETS
jgi:ATP-dependent Clp protease adapter protein ClpS